MGELTQGCRGLDVYLVSVLLILLDVYVSVCGYHCSVSTYQLHTYWLVLFLTA